MKNEEQWMELCALAAIEQDPDKLLPLVQEINRLLEEKERRLFELRRINRPPSSQPPPKGE